MHAEATGVKSRETDGEFGHAVLETGILVLP